MIAEAMRNSKIPIVTGIGHQKDSVLADMLADEAAITPTDAADKIVEAQNQKKPDCAPLFTLLITLFSLASSLVLLSMLVITQI